MSDVLLVEQLSPSTPGTAQALFYFKSDHKLYYMGEDGVEKLVAVSGDALSLFTGILGSAYGGTANGFTKFSGPTTTEKTFTLPDASVSLGYMNVPSNSQSAAYTTVLADAGKHILHPSSDANARTFTIDSNANVAYPVGTAITFVNQVNTVTIAITSDTMTLYPDGTTGSRTLAAYGMATALKIATTSWAISGVGLT